MAFATIVIHYVIGLIEFKFRNLDVFKLVRLFVSMLYEKEFVNNFHLNKKRICKFLFWIISCYMMANFLYC